MAILSEQQHPQYGKDKIIVDNLLQVRADPTEHNLVELARLKIRYRGFPGARDIQNNLETLLQRWELTEVTLFEKTRQIHAKGHVYRNQTEDQEDWI